LATAAFVDPHMHLDKALTGHSVRHNSSGTLAEALEIASEQRMTRDTGEIVERALTVVRMAVAHGTTFIRTHVDVCTAGGLTPIKAMLVVREACKDVVDIQIVAFPQDGILKDPGAEGLLREAMVLGANLIGGMPANEVSVEDSRRHIDIAFEIAREFNADVDMHIDETDDVNSRTLEMLADRTIADGYEGRVTAGHACAMSVYPDDYAEMVIAKVKRASIGIVTNPATNLMLQGRGTRQPRGRGITRVKELLAAGINVSFGQDNVDDAYYPFGQADALEVGLLTAHAAQLSSPDEIRTVFSMCSENAARTMRLNAYGIGIGNWADLVIVDARDETEALRLRPDRLLVMRHGKVLAKTETHQAMYV
jgi:cytosine deaminase